MKYRPGGGFELGLIFMKKTVVTTNPITGTAKAPRKVWTAPRVDRIDAGQAEVGTRAAADGAFSTS